MAAASDIRHSLVRWLNTFPGVELAAADLESLADGVVLCRVMHDMCGRAAPLPPTGRALSLRGHSYPVAAPPPAGEKADGNWLSRYNVLKGCARQPRAHLALSTHPRCGHH
jgi:hypothetical protein